MEEGEMKCTIRYLPYEEEGPARDIREKIRYKDYTPSGQEVDELWEEVGEEEVEGKENSKDAHYLSAIWPRWNAGSGGESEAFARRECEDCDVSFTGEVLPGQIDLRERQKNAEAHEEETGHTVERSNRSLSVGDIVQVGNTLYLCQRIGWEEIGIVSTRSHAGYPVE